MRSVGLNCNSFIKTFLPYQPLLINIVNLTKKGCSVYCKFLKKRSNLNTTLAERENKWHRELNCTFGSSFWNKTYTLAADIKNENKIKWFQFQINRNSLFTNYKVNKCKPNISPQCTFCSHLDEFSHTELVSHLFDFALKLWQELKHWLVTLNLNLPLNRAKLLFGIHEEDALFYGGKIVQFQDWNDIYDCLSRIPECTAQDVALSPTQALVPDTPAVDPARTE